MPQGVTEKKICRRCLLSQVPDLQELEKAIRERISLMPEEERVSAEEQQRRLAVCRNCDHLNSGTCGLCGCYVELRAAKVLMHCPCVPKKW